MFKSRRRDHTDSVAQWQSSLLSTGRRRVRFPPEPPLDCAAVACCLPARDRQGDSGTCQHQVCERMRWPHPFKGFGVLRWPSRPRNTPRCLAAGQPLPPTGRLRDRGRRLASAHGTVRDSRRRTTATTQVCHRPIIESCERLRNGRPLKSCDRRACSRAGGRLRS